MARHGTLGPFDSYKESWSHYAERLGCYFIANDIEGDDKKHSILLSICGHQTFKLIRSLLDAQALETKSYDDLVKMVKDYYDPKPSIIVQRYKFNSQVKAAAESIATYVAALRQIAEYCDYKDSLQDMLQDRLVCGVNHQSILHRLLAEKDLTYKKGLELAKLLEAVKKGSLDIVATNTVPFHYNSHHKYQRKVATANITCHRCGGCHLASVYFFKDQHSEMQEKGAHCQSMLLESSI